MMGEASGSSMLQAAKSSRAAGVLSALVPMEVALNATQHYLEALRLAAQGDRNLYLYSTFLDSCEETFEVADPVSSITHTSTEGLIDLLDSWPTFTLQNHAVTVAQDFSYTAAFSTMTFDDHVGNTFNVNRTDFLKILSDGSIQKVHTYWDETSRVIPGTPEDTPYAQSSSNPCVKTMQKYFTALHELGTGQSYDYFEQFNDTFEVHDPFGLPPVTSVEELQAKIPELASAVAPKGFSVTVPGVATTPNPHLCSAHLKLHIVEGPVVDIIDIFEVTDGVYGKPDSVGSLKAVWHLPAIGNVR
jgi:hypothetical protein